MMSTTIFRDTKFRTNVVAISFVLPLVKTDLAAITILEKVLFYKSKNYPTQKDVICATENLYALDTAITHSIVNDSIVFKCCYAVADSKYVDNQHIFNDATAFMKEIIFDSSANRFTEKNIADVKKIVVTGIKSVLNQPLFIARKNLLKVVANGSNYGQDNFGSLKEIRRVKKADIKRIHEAIINAPYKIHVVGPIDENACKEIIDCYFKPAGILPHIEMAPLLYNQVAKIRKTKDVEQSTIYMLYRFNNNNLKSISLPRLFSELLGQSGTSRLFTEIREKRGLCYSIGSSAQRIFGVIAISLGVNKDTIDDSLRAIFEVMNSLNFNDDEVEEAKVMICSYLDKSSDNAVAICDSLIQSEYMGEKYSLTERKKRYMEISAKEVNDFAKKLEFVGYSVLKGVKSDDE